jgi:iron complex outermembrane receptor protein
MYGEAFRAPTFAELYNQNNPTVVGNPDLNPEQIKTIEMSWQNNDVDNVDMAVTLFKSHISDIINIDNSGQHENRGDIKTNGVELEVKYNLGRGSYLMGNYTYQDPVNKTTNTPMGDVSRHKAYVALNYRLDRDYNLYVDANYRGEQFRSLGDTREQVSGFTTANATLLVKSLFIKDVKFRLSVYNLFDEKAYDSSSPFDYPLAERSFMAELTYKF